MFTSMRTFKNHCTEVLPSLAGLSDLPILAAETAWRRLRAWIRKSPGMIEHLMQAGYKRGQRTFTPKQVQIIVDGVGEP